MLVTTNLHGPAPELVELRRSSGAPPPELRDGDAAEHPAVDPAIEEFKNALGPDGHERGYWQRTVKGCFDLYTTIKAELPDVNILRGMPGETLSTIRFAHEDKAIITAKFNALKRQDKYKKMKVVREGFVRLWPWPDTDTDDEYS